MRKGIIDILACPVCKGNLDLHVQEEQGDEIITGSLYCARCSEHYPIRETIPNLLPPDLRD
ncbi:methytransferase partner Trm112 [Chloroflexota bacterium]